MAQQLDLFNFPQMPFPNPAGTDFPLDFEFDNESLQQLLDPNFLPTLDLNSTSPPEFPLLGDLAGIPSTGPSPQNDSGADSTTGDLDLPSHSSTTGGKASSSHGKITEEERAMLAEDGVVIPLDAITLTKAEDRALKLVRRKIKNKLSAQDSRRKKKEYVDGLERRVETCTTVNIEMQTKVQALTTENKSLRQQLLQLKQVVARLTGNASATTTGTILMVLALSFSMFVNPSATPAAPNATLPLTGARTLKSLDSSAFSAVNPAALQDVISSWLGLARKEDHAAPLQPLPRTATAGGAACNDPHC